LQNYVVINFVPFFGPPCTYGLPAQAASLRAHVLNINEPLGQPAHVGNSVFANVA